MFERFTNRARRVVVLAQEEARLLNHDYIGTEHILLGLLADGEGIAARALDEIGIGLDTVRQQVEQIIGVGKKARRSGHIPFTPRAKKVLELSLREALRLGHNYIGTEHILLGLIREGEGVAVQILARLGGDLSVVRMHVIRLAPGGQGRAGQEPEDTAAAAEAAETMVTSRAGIRALLEDICERLANIEAHLGIARPDPVAAGPAGRSRVRVTTAKGAPKSEAAAEAGAAGDEASAAEAEAAAAGTGEVSPVAGEAAGTGEVSPVAGEAGAAAAEAGSPEGGATAAGEAAAPDEPA
jgi:Clp amino terminal domain, pathogenicity island component